MIQELAEPRIETTFARSYDGVFYNFMHSKKYLTVASDADLK